MTRRQGWVWSTVGLLGDGVDLGSGKPQREV